MSTPVNLSPEDQNAVTDIHEACNRLQLAIARGALQTGADAGRLTGVVVNNLHAPTTRLNEITVIVRTASLHRSIAAKLTKEEMVFVGLAAPEGKGGKP
jgi:hypothetical protein